MFNVEKGNVGDHLKCVFPKFEAERRHPWRVNGRSKFAKKIEICKVVLHSVLRVLLQYPKCSLHKMLAPKSTDPLGSGVWEFSLPPSYNPPSTAGRKRNLCTIHPPPSPPHTHPAGQKLPKSLKENGDPSGTRGLCRGGGRTKNLHRFGFRSTVEGGL